MGHRCHSRPAYGAALDGADNRFRKSLHIAQLDPPHGHSSAKVPTGAVAASGACVDRGSGSYRDVIDGLTPAHRRKQDALRATRCLAVVIPENPLRIDQETIALKLEAWVIEPASPSGGLLRRVSEGTSVAELDRDYLPRRRTQRCRCHQACPCVRDRLARQTWAPAPDQIRDMARDGGLPQPCRDVSELTLPLDHALALRALTLGLDAGDALPAEKRGLHGAMAAAKTAPTAPLAGADRIETAEGTRGGRSGATDLKPSAARASVGNRVRQPSHARRYPADNDAFQALVEVRRDPADRIATTVRTSDACGHNGTISRRAPTD